MGELDRRSAPTAQLRVGDARRADDLVAFLRRAGTQATADGPLLTVAVDSAATAVEIVFAARAWALEAKTTVTVAGPGPAPYPSRAGAR